MINKKLVVISSFPPYPDNFGAPTSLLYLLLANLPLDVSLYLYYFPMVNNNVSQVALDKKILNLKCKKVSQIRCSYLEKIKSVLVGAVKLLPAGYWRYPVSEKIIRDIEEIDPTYILLYPYWLINWQDCLQVYPTTVIAPDSALLHNIRSLKLHKFNIKRLVSDIIGICLNYILERKWGKKNVQVGFVGVSDLNCYQKVAIKKNGFYFSHMFVPSDLGSIIFANKPSINVLISGDAESVYIKNDLALLIQSLITNKNVIVTRFNFFFLGKNFDNYYRSLRSHGFNVTLEVWTEDYNEFLSKMDVQIFPICVGTGTKGKVLQAMAMGLICIGSKYAFENIRIGDDIDVDSIRYRKPEEIPEMLVNIAENPKSYFQLAHKISDSVRLNHDVKKIARLFWNKVCRLG